MEDCPIVLAITANEAAWTDIVPRVFVHKDDGDVKELVTKMIQTMDMAMGQGAKEHALGLIVDSDLNKTLKDMTGIDPEELAKHHIITQLASPDMFTQRLGMQECWQFES